LTWRAVSLDSETTQPVFVIIISARIIQRKNIIRKITMPWPKPLSSVLKNTLSKSIQYGTEILHQRIPYSPDNPYLEGIFAPERQEPFPQI
jgi:hypothetical protein